MRRRWSIGPAGKSKHRPQEHAATPATMSVPLLEKLDLNGEQIDGQEEEEEVEEKAGGELTKSKKKRKKKKPASASSETTNGENGVPKSVPASAAGQKAAGKAGKGKKQTSPPSIPIKDLFPNNDFPVGQIMEHPAVDS